AHRKSRCYSGLPESSLSRRFVLQTPQSFSQEPERPVPPQSTFSRPGNYCQERPVRTVPAKNLAHLVKKIGGGKGGAIDRRLGELTIYQLDAAVENIFSIRELTKRGSLHFARKRDETG